jgi:hypothetical protein
MQPYFLPYIGYWQLLNYVDIFIVYDNIQFTKKGWFHRNNFLMNGKKTLFTIPLKKDSDYLDVRDRYLADDSARNLNKILAQMEQSYRKAPFYSEIQPLLKRIINYDNKNLFQYIFNSIQEIVIYLGIETKLIKSSDIDMDHSLSGEMRVLELCKKVEASTYINSMGGIELYNFQNFEDNKLKLLFMETKIEPYKQFTNDFVPYLSIIDSLMFNSKESVQEMLQSFKLSTNE